MTGVNVNEGSETFTRLIGRLSMEINQLTRETPLLEGRLLELEAQSHPTVAQFYESRRRSARRASSAGSGSRSCATRTSGC